MRFPNVGPDLTLMGPESVLFPISHFVLGSCLVFVFELMCGT